MTQRRRLPLPSGLPKQFSDGRPGFQRLQKFLKIPNTKAVEAVLAAVKDALQHVPVAKLQGADRRRVLLLAFYEKPDSRRELWRQMLSDRPSTASHGEPVPSLEFIALERHDAEFRERQLDTAAVQDALRDYPDLVESVADAPVWQRPALAAWPELHRDIAEWDDLADDRRETTLLAVFAVATVLDDLRLLQRAARCVDTLADEFVTLLDGKPGDSVTREDDSRAAENDIIRQWKATCDAITAAASALGEDPLRPELLADMSRQVNALTDLRGPVSDALSRASPEKLLQRAHDSVAAAAGSDDSPIAPSWTEQLAAHWRLAYPLPADFDVESLRADVERVEAELENALNDWRAARRHYASLNEQHQQIKREADADDDPLKRLDAQDREPELAEELHTAATAVRSARDRIFLVVAPKDQKFDPRRDYLVDEASRHAESPGVESPTRPPSDIQASPENDGERATQDAGEPASPIGGELDQDARPEGHEAPSPAADSTTEPEQDAKLAVEEPAPADLSPPLDRRPASAIEGLWRALAAGRPGIAYHVAQLCAEHRDASVPPTMADVIAASMLAPSVHSPDSESVRDLRAIFERIDPATLLRDERPQPERDALSLLLFSATLRPALFAPTTGAPALLRAVRRSDTLKPVYDLATRVADHADRLLGVRLQASMLQSSETGTWQDQFDALAGRVRAWQAGADSKRNLYGPADTVWRDLIGRDGVLGKLMRLITDPDKSVRPDVEAIHERISDQRTLNELVHRTDRRGRKRNQIEGRALRQIWNDVQPAVQLSGQWLSLMDTRPDTAGFVNQRIDAIHNDLKRVGVTAIETLDGAANTTASGNLLMATLPYARNAVNELLQLFNRSATFTESTRDANVILSRDLLYVPDQEIDAAFRPVASDVTRLLACLLDTAAHADTMRAAFDARLERDDFIGARLALDFLETEEDGDACMASLNRRVDDRRRTLRAALRDTQKDLERAFCRGQLSADDRDGMAAGLAALRQAAEPSPSTLRLAEVEALTGSSRRLDEIDEGIKDSSRKSIEMVRVRLRNVPDDQMDEAARDIVARTITQGYVQTAHE